MTGGTGSVTANLLPKWRLALVVVAPVALGLGYMYYKNNTKPSSKSSRKTKGSPKKNGAPATDKQVSIDVDCPPKSTFEHETQLEKALRHKNEGNEWFKKGKYDEAIALYNEAIEICPMENKEILATFYQNRAAAYEQLKKCNSVKADCTKAIELRPKYPKALLRRAKVMEYYNDLESAFEDVMGACILEEFSNPTMNLMADRVLKQLAKQHAMEYLANRKLIMPSKYFIKTYISIFQKDPVFARLENNNDSNISAGFVKILECLREEKYDDVIPLCNEEINSSDPNTLPQKMEVLLLRATFYLLLGNFDAAIEDLGTIIDSDSVSNDVKVNALIKRAILFMHIEELDKCLSDFKLAVELDPECNDIYHQRGQVYILMDKIDEAREDFKKAIDLNPNFGIAFVQKCYTDYLSAASKGDIELIEKALKGYKEAIEKFPDCSECYTLYAMVLSEMQEYRKADMYFAKSLEKDPNNATVYVHRGLLQLKWNSDVDKAIEYINKALSLDDKSDFAYEALGTIEIQRKNLTEAIELFDKALALGNTVKRFTHLFILKDAVKIHLIITDKFGITFDFPNFS